MDNNEIPFVMGNVVTKDTYVTQTEMQDIIEDIQHLMIEHGLIRIDLYINPYHFPQELKQF